MQGVGQLVGLGADERRLCLVHGKVELLGGIEVHLLAVGIGPGDEVITTPFTFIATTSSVSLTGAQFVFADIDPRTYNIDVADVERKITKKTKAILPVHLYGYPANMDAIMHLANEHGLKVIEDCAQAHLASCDGVMVGGIGDAGCFSFYPSKNLGACGDAGCITTNDDEIANRCRSLRHSGRALGKAYEYDLEGSTLRMDEVQAAILRVKLPHLEEWTEKRRKAAAWYEEGLAGVPVVLPPTPPAGSSQSYYVFTIRAEKRDELQAFRAQSRRLPQRGKGRTRSVVYSDVPGNHARASHARVRHDTCFLRRTKLTNTIFKNGDLQGPRFFATIEML